MESLTSSGADPAPRTELPAPPPMPHVVLLASPGAGHLIPMAELARRLVAHHGFAATLVTFANLANPDAQSAVLSSLPAAVGTATLPAVSLDDLPADARIDVVLFELIDRSLPQLRDLLRSIGSTAPLAALVPDFFGSVALPLAAELGVPGYIFFPTNLTVLSLMRRVVELHDGAAAGEYRDLPETVELPGGLSMPRADIPDGFRDSKVPAYAYLVEEGRRYRTAAGFLVSTFHDMEPAAADEFRKAAEEGAFPPVYSVGPFVLSSSDEPGASAILGWLDRQPTRSVVYVSFGSGGALSVEQTAELAAGLEMSGHRFLWIVRMPSHHKDEDHVPDDDDNPLAWLPEGFLERTQGRGLAVAAWAPQVRVLSHPATAAFVSHCGWNSTLESVVSGVPMVAWPLYAEQEMNAVLLAEVVGVALRPTVWEDGGVVSREKVSAAVKEIMEGEKGRVVRRQAGELQHAARRAWLPEGSSRLALAEVANKWKLALSEHK